MESSSFFWQININKDKLLKNLVDIKNIANIQILVCYGILFTKEGLLKNIAFFVGSGILLIYIICLFLFSFRDFALLRLKIKDITFAIKNMHLIKVYTKRNKRKNRINNNSKQTIKIHRKSINKKFKQKIILIILIQKEILKHQKL